LGISVFSLLYVGNAMLKFEHELERVKKKSYFKAAESTNCGE